MFKVARWVNNGVTQAKSFGALWTRGRDLGWTVALSLSSPSDWLLTWLWKGVEKVVPQPTCSSRAVQNTTARVDIPAQVLWGLQVGEGQAGEDGREAAPGLPAMSVCLFPTGWRTDPRALWCWGHR